MICCDEHAKHLRDASCPWCERDEAVRLLKRCEQHMYNPFEPDNQSRLYNDLHAYLARVGK